MKKKIIILLAVLIIVFLIVFLIIKLNRKNPDELVLYGNIEIRQADVGFRVEGRVKKLFREEGDEVKKGELLAIIDDTTYIKNPSQILNYTGRKA